MMIRLNRLRAKKNIINLNIFLEIRFLPFTSMNTAEWRQQNDKKRQQQQTDIP